MEKKLVICWHAAQMSQLIATHYIKDIELHIKTALFLLKSCIFLHVVTIVS